MKRKKTAIVKKDASPQYQESFNFRIEEEELEQSGLRVTCMQHQPILEKGKLLTRRSFSAKPIFGNLEPKTFNRKSNLVLLCPFKRL